jgi:hypothetical protein
MSAAHEDDEPDDFGWDDGCLECDGTGERLICPDDMCRGIGDCIHGDGIVMCAACQGNG